MAAAEVTAKERVPASPVGSGGTSWTRRIPIRTILIVAGLGFLAASPLMFVDSFLRILGSVLMFVALAQGWNIIGGFAGYASFGNVVFFGVGGYTVAVLMTNLRWPFWPALLVAVAVAAAWAVLVGLPVLRLRGHYFAIATLGVAEGTREIVINLPGVTGGGAGITIPAVGSLATTDYPGNIGFYYMFLALAVVATLVVWMIARSRFGYALRAIHQDEDAAAAAGINTTRAKTFAFVAAAGLTAIAGGIFAFQQVTVYPQRMFSVEITVLMVVMAVIGGAGTVAGPVVGAVALQFLSEYLRQGFLEYHTLIFGAIVVLAVLFLPQGLVSFAREGWRTKRISFRENLRRYSL